jgi:tRNA pseudouridine55 synthase
MDGLLLVDKPSGCTSHDVVSRARRLLGQRRIGHTGTLDPFATGLLALLLGRATRLARFLSGQEKTYSGLVRLGVATDTGDREGRPLADPVAVAVDPEEVRRAARSLLGPSEQVPPPYSAKRVQGRRSYRLAREGRAPRLAPVPVTVSRLEAELEGEGRIRFSARVSAGTYLRVLAEEMGRRLGLPAHLEELRREAVGELRVEEALPLETSPPEALRAALLPPRQIPLGLPDIRVGPEAAEAVRHGRPVFPEGLEGTEEGAFLRLLGPDGGLLAVGEAGPRPAGPDGRPVRPRVVLV